MRASITGQFVSLLDGKYSRKILVLVSLFFPTQVDNLFSAKCCSKKLPILYAYFFQTQNLGSNYKLTGSNVMAKKFTFGEQKANFLGVTFELVISLIPVFNCGKICKINGLFALAVGIKVINSDEKKIHLDENLLYTFGSTGTVLNRPTQKCLSSSSRLSSCSALEVLLD